MHDQHKRYICYHKNCSDGFTAAFVAHLYYTELNKAVDNIFMPVFVPVNPGITPDEVEPDNATIVMFDVALKRDVLLDWKKRAINFDVLDHHKSNKEVLEDLKFCHFDMEKSGAGLAWEFFFEEQMPWWVEYTQDRDLWAWKLPNSREINAYLAGLEFTFEAYSKLLTMTKEEAFLIGREIMSFDQTKIDRALNAKHFMNFDGYTVAVVNSAHYQSELGNILTDYGEFGVAWYVNIADDGNLVAQLSLRSVGDFDVSVIAKKYGGGGHKNAAGCRIPLNIWTKMLENK